MTQTTATNAQRGDADEVLVVDLLSHQLGETGDPGLAKLTERHHMLLDVKMRPVTVEAFDKALGGGSFRFVVLVAKAGLPSLRTLWLGRKLTGNGRTVYLYWPSERALESLDQYRFWSYVRHHVFVRLVQTAQKAIPAQRPHDVGLLQGPGNGPLERASVVLRNAARLPRRILRRLRSVVGSRLRARRVVRDLASRLRTAQNQADKVPISLRLAATKIFGSEITEIAQLPGPERPVRGLGAYVRLDYWASLKTGGSYGHTCFLAKAAAEVSSDFLCLFANSYELLDDYGIRQKLLPYQPNFASSADLIDEGHRLEVRLWDELDRMNPTYVYERSVLGSLAAARWCAKNNVPYILEYNGSELAMARSFGTPYKHETELEAIEAYTMNVATLINVISEPVSESLVARGIPKERILVNPNAVDPSVYAPLQASEKVEVKARYGFEKNDVVIGFCGTFGGWHGIETLVAALPEICAANARTKFLLIGDGNLKHLVQSAVTEHSLGDRVCDLGLIPQLEGAAALAACDILVAPHSQNIDGGTFFGSPTKLFEYMAMGAGIVCSDLAQLGEVMRPALSVDEFRMGQEVGDARGILVTPGDVDEFVAAVGVLAEDAELRRVLGRNAREAAINNYTWTIHVENIWRAIAELPLTGYVRDNVVAKDAT